MNATAARVTKTTTKVCKAEFPAASPEPALFTAKPVHQAEVRRNAVVRPADSREGKVTAVGAHRVRVLWADGTSSVVLRGQVAALTTAAPAPKRTGSKGPKT